MANRRYNQGHRFCLNQPILDLTLRLSLDGGCEKCRPIIPKVSMKPSSSTISAIGGGGFTLGRNMSVKKRVCEARNHVVPHEVPLPALTEATINSVQRNIAFRRAIATIKSERDHLPGINEVKNEVEDLQVEPATVLINGPVKAETEDEETKDENMELMMPRVATSGGIPNGREIEGILRLFSKERIIIVCVCHGYWLSPEEFFRHAGGWDIANTMKYIYFQPTMIVNDLFWSNPSSPIF